MKHRWQKFTALLLFFSCFALVPRMSKAQQTTTTAPASETNKMLSDFDSPSYLIGRATIKFDRLYNIHVDNRSTGRITIIGWDKDFIEATARSNRGDEMIVVRSYFDDVGTVLYIKADYRPDDSVENNSNPAAPVGSPSPVPLPSPTPAQRITPSTISNPGFSIRFGQSHNINIEVKLPRRAELMPIQVNKSDVDVANIETPVKILGASSSITLNNIESAEVSTKNGDVTVDNATGLIDVITRSGNVLITNAKTDVRVLSLNGAVDIRCARGRVNASTTDGAINFLNVSGDVDATNTYGAITFTGAIRKDGRYYLKSMSGRVEMKIQPQPSGFSATLSSYRNKVEVGFPLKIKQKSSSENDNHPGSTEQRIIGSYGNGQALITLNSFDREVILTKATENELKGCP